MKSAAKGKLKTTPADGKYSWIGRAFHTVDEDGDLRWQGEVIDYCDRDRFLVQLYEWAMGEASVQKVVTMEQLMAEHPNGRPVFTFYDSMETANAYSTKILQAEARRGRARG